MLHRALPLFVLVTTVSSCAVTKGVGPNDPATGSSVGTTAITSWQPAGPQSYTPEMKARSRTTLVHRIWSAPIGRTDYRTTMAFVDGNVWIGAKAGPLGPAGVYVIDGTSGARRALLPAARGDVVGLAFGKDRVVTTSSLGEVAVTTKQGRVLLRAKVGAPIATPPTLLDAEREGAQDIAVGDATGRVTVVDGRTGRIRWTRALSSPDDVQPSVGAGLALADLDGDGTKEIVAGTEGGKLAALRVADGRTMWETIRPSPLFAAPVLSDVDGDGKLEIIVGWADGDVAILDGKTGHERWSTRVEDDDGDSTGILASPMPLRGRLLVPTSRYGDRDATVLHGPHDRAFRARRGAIVATPVVGGVQPATSFVAAITATRAGHVLAFDHEGGVHELFRVDGVIEAPGLLADLEGNGLRQLVVATADGRLVAIGINGTLPPLVPRARGSLANDGVLPPIGLGWRLR